MTDNERNTLQETITHFLEDMKKEQGDSFSLEKVNLSEMARRTGISRKRLRLIQKNGFKVLPNGNKNKQKEHTVLSGYTGIIEEYLKRGVRNSHTITDILQDNGYTGSRSQVKRYIASHLYLIPAKREIVSPQGNRGRRYKTEPGECFQMDWGFVNVDTGVTTYRAACFAMICHHCGSSYVEFFPNAKQENLFIGIIHAFEHLGIPKHVLTDNMKSVVNGRDADGHPLWNHEYETFMDTIGFQTKLCKPHPLPGIISLQHTPLQGPFLLHACYITAIFDAKSAIQTVLYLVDSYTLQVLICPVIILWQTGTVLPETALRFVWVPFRDTDDHTGSGTGKQDSVCIQHILHFFLLVFTISSYFVPSGVSVEIIEPPFAILIPHVRIPKQTGIIQFQTLDLDLSGSIFQVVR